MVSVPLGLVVKPQIAVCRLSRHQLATRMDRTQMFLGYDSVVLAAKLISIGGQSFGKGRLVIVPNEGSKEIGK